MTTFMRPKHCAPAQRGVVLIIALILLVVISLLAVTSMRNVSSSESVASNVRTSELATQAAEIALRHCESSVLEVLNVAAGATPTFTTTFTASNMFTTAVTPARWQSVSTWDSTSTATYVLPLSLVNQAGLTSTYKRPPECMVEPLPMVIAGKTSVSQTASFVITSRGFGPEVAAADSARSRPSGSEVWMQSHVELDQSLVGTTTTSGSGSTSGGTTGGTSGGSSGGDSGDSGDSHDSHDSHHHGRRRH